MRAADPPVHYLVGTPKGRLTHLEKHLIAQPWQQARPGVQVKLLAQEGELYVLAQSRDRVAKERAMRRRQLKRLWARLKQLSTMRLTREELLMNWAPRATSPAPPGAWSRSRLPQRTPPSAIGSIATNCGRHACAKAGICCAPISSKRTRPSCGAIICC